MDTDSKNISKEQYNRISKEISDFVNQFTEVNEDNSNSLISIFEANHNE